MNPWTRLRQSFWFIPALLCVGAVGLAEGLIVVDHVLGEPDLGVLGGLVTLVGESGSRDLLGAIAGSMLTVASTTFSITIAVLALSSSNYGPRLVRNFMADRGNQIVLGIFVATFLYSMMVLRSIRVVGEGSGDDVFVPHLAVNVAVLLAVASIGVLVYFIHHISDSVQVWTLAEQVRADLIRAVDRLYPDGPSDSQPEEIGHPAVSRFSGDLDEGRAVRSDATGYVQGVALDRLLAEACERSLVVDLKVRPGDHVTVGSALAVLGPLEQLGDEDDGWVRRAIRLGRARTPEEDVEFPALLLEEMAVRALSPGTNDPYTAINALDSLASGLVRLAGRSTPDSHRYDSDGELRVIAPHVSITDLLDHLLNAMRAYAVTHPTVLHRTLDLVAQVGAASHQPSVRLRLDTHVQRLVEAFSTTTPHDSDLDELGQHAVRVRQQLLGS